MLWLGSLSDASTNLLKNGSFENGVKDKIPLYWGKEYYNCYVESGGKDGAKCLRITNDKLATSMGAQEFSLDGRKSSKVTVSAWIKVANVVPGKEDWEKANLQILFFDEDDRQVGGWPQLGPWEGTFDWLQAARIFRVPAEARKAKVVFGLNNCTGTLWIDDIQVVIGDTRQEDPYNLVSNGNFEVWEDWAYGGTEGGGVYSPGYKGNGLLKISNPVPCWSFASQSIPLDGAEVKKVKIEAFVKIQDVTQGARPWQQARINVEFIDKNGKRIGGWPIVFSETGTFDWKKIENSFDVPEESARMDIFAGLMEVGGTIWVDDLRVEGYKTDGSKAARQPYFETNTEGWFALSKKDTYPKNTAPDVSFLLDKPAGKHGFLKVKNGHFYFADGTRARFWGTNIVGADCFVDHKTAELTAERLARFGCNLVRIHHMDAYWANPNIFDSKHNDTQHLDAKQLEKLDYLIYQLEKRGIYIFMDLLVDRQFKSGDNVDDYKNVERGAKFSGFYNERLIELQKKYAKQLLTHTNPYTKKRYVDDPGIASIKIINEAMLYYISTQVGLSQVYLQELDALWNNWLKEKYGSRDALKAAWTDKYGRCDLKDGEDFGNIVRGETLMKFQRGGGSKLADLREKETMLFYYEVQTEYYQEMENYLKGLGVKVPISGSNHWYNVAADVKSNAVLDYIDRHRYWDHPKYGYGTDIVFEDQPMVKFPEEALPNNFAYYRVAGMPFVISEWNCCFPNEYRAEGPMIMAAYAALQDWDAVLQFSFAAGGWGKVMQDNFDIGAWPQVFAEWPAAALLFYRGDVAKAKQVLTESLLPQDVFGSIREDNPIFNEPLLPLVTGSQINFVDSIQQASADNPSPILEKYVDLENQCLTSDTGQLKWDWGQGMFKIDTPRTQGGVGFIKGEGQGKGEGEGGNQGKEVGAVLAAGQTAGLITNDLRIYPSTEFSSIFVSSLDKKPIRQSGRLLLTATARAENTGQKYNAAKTQLKEVGGAPVLVEGVDAKIWINTKSRSAKVYALDLAGNRKKGVATQKVNGGVSFCLSSANNALFYEVVIK
jgi:hypothetical protein